MPRRNLRGRKRECRLRNPASPLPSLSFFLSLSHTPELHTFTEKNHRAPTTVYADTQSRRRSGLRRDYVRGMIAIVESYPRASTFATVETEQPSGKTHPRCPLSSRRFLSCPHCNPTYRRARCGRRDASCTTVNTSIRIPCVQRAPQMKTDQGRTHMRQR